jgi:hypothetical protein
MILLAIGAGLAVWAKLIYPSPDTGISSPAYSSLAISATAPVGHVTYSVRQVSLDVARLQVSVSSSPFPSAQVSRAKAILAMALPPRFQFMYCPPRYCTNFSNGYASTYSQSLVFGTGTTSRTFWVRSRKFGVNFDPVFGYAAIPQVYYQTSELAASAVLTVPTLQVIYRHRSASAYDWSSFPPATRSNSSIGWQEALANGETAGRIAAGVSHKRQAQDANSTFLAGLFAGFAGGAILAGLQGLLAAGK